MNDYSYSCEFYVYPHDADATKHLTPTILGNYILDTAGLAAKKYGFGMDEMHKTGVAWVVSRMSIKIKQLPKEYTTIKIKTWIQDVNQICSTRNYLVYDESNNIIAQATTLWSIIDITTRKIVDLMEKSTISAFIQEKEEPDFSLPRTRRIDLKKENTTEYHHIVKYSDIDMNNHVNSMKYLQWVIDTLDIKKTQKGIEQIDINYTKEALYGEDLTIYQTTNENTETFEIQQSNTTCCKIKLTLKNTDIFICQSNKK